MESYPLYIQYYSHDHCPSVSNYRSTNLSTVEPDSHLSIFVICLLNGASDWMHYSCRLQWFYKLPHKCFIFQARSQSLQNQTNCFTGVISHAYNYNSICVGASAMPSAVWQRRKLRCGRGSPQSLEGFLLAEGFTLSVANVLCYWIAMWNNTDIIHHFLIL